MSLEIDNKALVFLKTSALLSISSDMHQSVFAVYGQTGIHEKCIFTSPNPKLGKGLAPTTEQLIVEMYLSDEMSCMRLETRTTIRSFTVLTHHSKMMPHYRHPCFKS